MSNKTIHLPDDLHRYLVRISVRETDVMRRLREETARLPERTMQISPEQGQLMALLAKAIGAVRALEIGTFTGYSALAVAQALQPGGTLVACDANKTWTNLATKAWSEAGVADRIELRLGDAAKSLEDLEKEGKTGTFDFVFIDADKKQYRNYYEAALRLTRPGALILLDNMFRDGKVVDRSAHDVDTAAIRELNAFLAGDERVDISVVPISDGLTIARKR